MRKKLGLCLGILLLSNFIFPQSRINYNNRELFLSGSNVAWINFARDIGPGTTNFTQFNTIFKTVHENGGNSMRLWLHTTGTSSPHFDIFTNKVDGPGDNTISDLKQILDLAWQNEVGLVLCLWSFDMLRKSNGTTSTTRANLMLTDTAYTNAYIRNSLIPMVEALKEHPGIISWEVFNEPEGMSNEFGWDITYHVPMHNIQRFINLVTGAIHRTDTLAKVTNGSWSFLACTDVTNPGLQKYSAQDKLAGMSEIERNNLEKVISSKYGDAMNAEDVYHHMDKIKSINAANINYYRDDRLIAAGGDPDGTLDFNTVHYYDWAGTVLSPFHYPYSHWELDKPLAVAEFFLNDAFDVPHTGMFRLLYNTGYSGALTWSWGDDATGGTKVKTKIEMMDMYQYFHEDIVVIPKTGTIYVFKTSPSVIEKGDSAVLTWDTEIGSSVTLNGEVVSHKDSMIVNPLVSTFYDLSANGEITSTNQIRLEVHPSGRIFSFEALPDQVGSGERTLLKWTTARGSIVSINGISVNEKDSMEVNPLVTTDYVLKAEGDITETRTVRVKVLPAEQVNRALLKPVTVSSSEQGSGNDIPGYVVDGNLSTRWSSVYSDAQWLEIDLVKQYEIKKVVLNWALNDYAKNYRIGLAVEKPDFKLIYTKSNGTGGTETIDNLEGDGRYLRIMLDKRNDVSAGFSLWEVEIYGIDKTTSVDSKKDIPESFSLSQNYPNPFNPVTTIEYFIPEKSFVNLEVYDILGNRITVLVNEEKNTGTFDVQFEGSNFASGVYYYRMKALLLNSNARQFVKTGKMILLK